MELSGRTALVTGGAIRVGRAITLALAEQGMRLVVHYNASSHAADALVAAIRADGGEAVAIGADLADAAAVERLAKDALAAFGGLDVLVNNAAVFPQQSLDDTDADLLEHTLAVNLKAPFLLTRHLAAALRASRGAVVNMADLAGLQTWDGYAAHGIAKAGVVHLTQVAARALAPEVRVNAIAPGTVLAPDAMDEGEVRRLAERAPLRRNGSPEDVVQAMLYLLRADFVTGQVLVVDGGRILRN
jgi:pteridine reductase